MSASDIRGRSLSAPHPHVARAHPGYGGSLKEIQNVEAASKDVLRLLDELGK